jgi:hypothetical protein
MRHPLRNFILLLALAHSAKPAPAPAAPPDAATITERSVDAMRRDWQAAEEYDHFERDREKDGSKTWHVLMIEGSAYRRLTAVNDKPLPADDEQQEQQKLREEVASRCGESADERAERIAKYRKERDRNRRMIGELTKAFTFAVAGKRRVRDRQTWVLNASPRPDYEPPDMETKALTGMEGKLWIDSATFEWVRVEAHVVRPVSIEGFLATVEPGTVFELERAPVAKGIWLPAHFSVRSKARILGLIGHNTRDEETYTDYQPTSSMELPACPGK